jgi:hypothetical protein
LTDSLCDGEIPSQQQRQSDIEFKICALSFKTQIPKEKPAMKFPWKQQILELEISIDIFDFCK